MRLFVFELRRACEASIGWFALLGLATSTLIFWGLLASGARIAGGASPDLVLAWLGFVAANVSGMSTAERNRGAVIEDVWWSLEPRVGLQTLQISLAWAIIGAAQAAISASIVGLAIGASAAGVIAFVLGYAAGLPLGVVQTALARRLRGTTTFAGLTMLASLFFAGPIAASANRLTPEIAWGSTIAIYLSLTFLGSWALTRGLARA